MSAAVNWEEYPACDWRSAAVNGTPGGFQSAVQGDNLNVFLNPAEFGERRSVKYDGEIYANIPVVLNGCRQTPRQTRRPEQDHAQGFFIVSHILHCRLRDLGGVRPEQDTPLFLNEKEGGTFFRKFYVRSSNIEMGMLKIELEALDE